jgi:N-acetylmuramoyl-L-alanine amidase
MMPEMPSHVRSQQSSRFGAPRFLAVVVLLSAAAAMVGGFRDMALAPRTPPTLLPPFTGDTPAPATSVPTVDAPPTGTPSPAGPLPIGIVAGHWGYDSGAVCDGWLEEVDVNLSIAWRVVSTLRAMAYETDLLEEFDPRLEGYRGRALVSIHADACTVPYATGFKVARVADSAVPEVEDRLVGCLISRYQARTGLPFHEWSITPDMTHYHTFYEIDSHTPAAIIEVGFMAADRDILLNRQSLVAQGIVDGIVCFLDGEEP